MNKMIFVAALMLTACSPKQDKLPDSNTIEVDSTPDNNVQAVVAVSPPAQLAELKQTVKAPAPKEWVDKYQPCVEATNDATACQKKAEDASGITTNDKDLMADGAADATRRFETVYKPCMAKIHNDKKCSDLYENFDDQGNRVKDPD